MRRDCQHIKCSLPNCDCPIDYEGLEFVDEVDIPEIGNLDVVKTREIRNEFVKGYEKDIVYYALPKDSRSQRILESLLNTIAGRNRTGKVIGRVKDVLNLFVPYGGKIDRLTDTLKNILFKPKQERGKNMNWIVNRLREKSTWRGIIAVATGVGISVSPEQANAIVALGVAAIGVFEAFFKEPQSPDA